MKNIINWIKAHMGSVGSYAAIVLSVIGVLLASGQVVEGSTFAVVLGFIVTILTTLGFKPVPVKPEPAPEDKTEVK